MSTDPENQNDAFPEEDLTRNPLYRKNLNKGFVPDKNHPELLSSPEEVLKQKQENERRFCRALLAGIHGIEPDQLTEEFLKKAHADWEEKRQKEAEEKGWEVIRSEDAEEYIDREYKLLKEKIAQL